ncbi:MAG TPA: glycosyltransferase family 2 protein [Bryobacteraceae bacterium]|nr:glycosyltransferase family 2 protein [Bryobacteraceae bacterium]
MAVKESPAAGIELPTISVVIETYTITREYPLKEGQAQLASVLDRLEQQSYPRDRTEILVVLDQAASEWEQFLQTDYPRVRTAFIRNGTYLSMKNLGFELTRGDMIALIDGDCFPVADWLERIAAAYRAGADAVAGKTRYRPEHPFAETFSVFDFGHVQADRLGKTFAFNANNLAFRRSVVTNHRFDSQAKRNGGCFLLWRKLKLANYDMIYDPKMFVGHGNDYWKLGFVRKHVERGFDAINLFRTSDPALLEGARYIRFGPLVPLGMFASRVLFDLRRIVSNRQDLGIQLVAVPYYFAASVFIRSLEALGGMIALWNPEYFYEH